MSNFLLIATGLLYFSISAILFLFGANFLYLSWRAWRQKDLPPSSLPQPLTAWPTVTVQLPIYNELYVAERVIQAAAQFDYPSDKLQIQVLDDSTDETVEIVQRLVTQLSASGLNIEQICRADRVGYKAGALQVGLASATGEFIAIFDADFVPPVDFLKQALPYLQEPHIAFVQTRWGHLNEHYSWLTFVQSLAIDAHFAVEQFVRSRVGFWFNFNGTGGVWRREAIIDAGGWKADTLTEDLDLSYRAHLRGWRGRYTRDIVVPGELPPSMSGFRRQQHRWARGSMECALKLSPLIWRAPIPFSLKLQATLHMAGYTVHILVFLLTLLYPLVANFTALYPDLSTLYRFAYLFAVTSFAPTLFFIVGQQQLKRPWWQLLPRIVLVSVIGSGLMLNSVRAAWQIWYKPEGVFERTAKFGLGQAAQDWTQQRYQLQFDKIVYAELLLGGYALWTVWLALQLGSWGIAFFALLFGAGLILTAVATIAQALTIYRRQFVPAVP